MRARLIVQGADKASLAKQLERYAPMIGLDVKTWTMDRGYDDAMIQAWKTHPGVGVLILPESMSVVVKG